jgi:cytochrome P450
MATNPDIQSKAQAEIDSVVEKGCLPSLADRPRLTYIDAIVKEVMRCSQVLPLGNGHMTTEDDVHEGYFIPKGSVIYPNIW